MTDRLFDWFGLSSILVCWHYHQIDLFGSIQTNKTGRQSYSDTSPNKVSAKSLEIVYVNAIPRLFGHRLMAFNSIKSNVCHSWLKRQQKTNLFLLFRPSLMRPLIVVKANWLLLPIDKSDGLMIKQQNKLINSGGSLLTLTKYFCDQFSWVSLTKSRESRQI